MRELEREHFEFSVSYWSFSLSFIFEIMIKGLWLCKTMCIEKEAGKAERSGGIEPGSAKTLRRHASRAVMSAVWPRREGGQPDSAGCQKEAQEPWVKNCRRADLNTS